MKKSIICLGVLVIVAANLRAAPVFSDDFNSYTNGPLLGQGGWTITGTSVVNPIQVASGKVPLVTTGQDAYSALPGGILSYADGTSFYMGLDLNVSAAQATGDYFLHYTPTVGETSALNNRLFVKSSGAGYVLGWLAASGGGSGVLYGSTVLSLSTDYRVVLAVHAIAGATNDTAAIYVNPFDDLDVELNNTAYASFAWTGGSTAENHNVAAINLRQGTGANAPTLTLDNLNASQSFGEVSVYTAVPVPEPSSIALFLIGAAGLFIRRR